MLKNYIFTILLLLGPTLCYALQFNKALDLLEDHQKVRSIKHSVQAMQESALVEGAWGDPMLALKAQNLPSKTLAFDEEMMSGVMVSISQKVPLTNKFRYQKRAQSKQANSFDFKAQQQVRVLQRLLWRLGIEKENLRQNLRIVSESYDWVTQMLKVSQQLYTNGQISQQALFDVQIRQSELEVKKQSINAQMQELQFRLSYLVGDKESELNLSSINWNILDKNLVDESDFAQKSLEMQKESMNLMASAQRLNRIPDITLSLGYMARQMPHADNLVSFGVSFPIPLGKRTGAASRRTLELRNLAELELSDYQNEKESRLQELGKSLSRTQEELRILQERTIQYARSSREITGSSYKHGRATYFELLNSEIRLQELLSREAALVATIKNTKVERIYISGGQLK